MELSIKRTKEKTTFKESIKWGAILFIAVSILGFGIAYGVKYGTSIGKFVSARNRFDTDAIASIKVSTGELKTLGMLSIGSMVMILISSLLNMYFMIRVDRVSKTMTSVILTFFVISNGLGFGLLFLSFNAVELMSIFAIAGGIFGLIAIGSAYIKSANWLMPILMMGTMAVMIMSLVSVILYFTGVYSDKLFLWVNILSSFLTVGWTIFDFWRIRQFSSYTEWENMSERDQFVYPKFFGFRLASDLIAMIWRLAYFLLRSQR